MSRKSDGRKPEVFERTLPHDLDAERAVLGAILGFPNTLKDVIDVVAVTDFFREAHRDIYRTMVDLVEDGTAVDFITVKASLQTAGKLDSSGGPAYLASLSDGVPRSTNVAHYASIVKEKARLREAIYAANKLLANAYDADSPAATLAEQAAARLSVIAESVQVATGHAVPLMDVIPAAVERIQAAQKAGGGVTGISTGLADLDEMCSGLHPSEVTIIAARTSVGKTAMLLNIARYVGEYVGPALVYSLEMDRESLFGRLLASEASVNGQDIRTGRLSDEDWSRIGPALVSLRKSKIYVDDTASIAIGQMIARTRKFKDQYGLAMVGIDYVQLMRGSGRFENRTQEIGNVSRGIKAMAKELKVPAVVLGQLSRETEKRQSKRPQLSDLRESGDLEQDADTVILLYRPEQRAEDQGDEAEAIFAKQRNGPTGVVKLTWRKEFVRFENRT